MVIDYLSNLDVNNLSDGKVEIPAENQYANFVVAQGIVLEDATFEAKTVNLIPGHFALFSEDGHALCVSTADTYHKVVLKSKS